MAIDFPNAPTSGLLWPNPPVTGQPIYQWDGEKWRVPGYLPPPPPTAIWDPAHIGGANMTLDTTNLVATHSGAPQIGGARTNRTVLSGTYYMEFTTSATGFDPQTWSVGVADSTFLLNNLIGLNSNTFGVWNDGHVVFASGYALVGQPGWYNGVFIVSLEWNADTGQLRYRVNGSAWSAYTASPMVGLATYVCVTAGGLGSFTANFGATPYTYTSTGANWPG